MKKITKSEILAGKDLKHNFYVEDWDAEITIKPLTEKQNAQVNSIKQSGVKLEGGAVFDKDGNVDRVKSAENMKTITDIERTTMADFEGDATAVAYALEANGDETWTVDEVMSISPPGIVKKIAQEVYRISGVAPGGAGDAVRNFRGKRGGAGNSKNAAKRDTAGQNTG